MAYLEGSNLIYKLMTK